MDDELTESRPTEVVIDAQGLVKFVCMLVGHLVAIKVRYIVSGNISPFEDTGGDIRRQEKRKKAEFKHHVQDGKYGLL